MRSSRASTWPWGSNGTTSDSVQSNVNQMPGPCGPLLWSGGGGVPTACTAHHYSHVPCTGPFISCPLSTGQVGVMLEGCVPCHHSRMADREVSSNVSASPVRLSSPGPRGRARRWKQCSPHCHHPRHHGCSRLPTPTRSPATAGLPQPSPPALPALTAPPSRRVHSPTSQPCRPAPGSPPRHVLPQTPLLRSPALRNGRSSKSRHSRPRTGLSGSGDFPPTWSKHSDDAWLLGPPVPSSSCGSSHFLSLHRAASPGKVCHSL